jgi:hypothetical protein
MRALTVGDVIAHGTTALLGAREESPVLRRAIAALLWIMVAINARLPASGFPSRFFGSSPPPPDSPGFPSSSPLRA